MGEKNVATKVYMGRSEIFADLCNYVLYNGKQMIKPEDLCASDVTELGIPFTSKGKEIVERLRDVLKFCTIRDAGGQTIIVIGVENQSDVHYAMVVRNMVQDALNYASQVEKYSKVHRKLKDLTGSEYLSGFSKDEKLIPVITITVYWNTDSWDGPRTLHEMLEVEDKELLKFIPDYKMNLVVPEEIIDFSKFGTELQEVFQFLHNGKDKELLKNMVNNPDFDLSRDAVEVLNSCANIGIKISDKKGDVINMCEGWEALKKEVMEEAAAEGMARNMISMVENYLMKKNVQLEQALDDLSVTIEEYENAKNIVGKLS